MTKTLVLDVNQIVPTTEIVYDSSMELWFPLHWVQRHISAQFRSVNANSIDVNDVVEELHEIEAEIKTKADPEKYKDEMLPWSRKPHPTCTPVAEPFAMAIARGVDEGEVMDLWESDWWKQYPADDDLIVSVLKGEHGEDVARTINEFRGEHPELAHACIVKDVKVDWATMLLDAGFDEHPEAVVNVLCGASPHWWLVFAG